MNQLWGRVKKAHETSLDAELLAGIPLQTRSLSTKKVFAPRCICPEQEKADLGVDVVTNKKVS